MRSYQGYTFEKVLDEYALRFFTLLEWHFKLEARRTRELMTVSMLPHMHRREATIVMRQYEIAGDILKAKAFREVTPDEEAANIKRIRKIIGNG